MCDGSIFFNKINKPFLYYQKKKYMDIFEWQLNLKKVIRNMIVVRILREKKKKNPHLECNAVIASFFNIYDCNCG